MDNLSVIVTAWDPFERYWKYWYKYFKPNCNLKSFFLNEVKDVHFLPIKQLKTGTGEWSERLISGLKQIKDDYVIFMMEDYWLTEPIDIKKLERLYRLMRRQDWDVMRFYTEQDYCDRIKEVFNKTPFKDIYEYGKESDYLISCQPSIWKREYLLSCLRPEQTGWEFEQVGTKRIRSDNLKIYCYLGKSPIQYCHALNKGNYRECAKKMII